jgi:MYXO-CTERM domain-containing protein
MAGPSPHPRCRKPRRPHPPAGALAKDGVFLFVLAVPALLVVLLGYVVGYGLWSLLPVGAGAEPAGWVTGLLLLAAVVLTGVRRRRRR